MAVESSVRVNLDIDLTKYRKSIREANKSLIALGGQARALDKQLQFNPTGINKINRSLEVLEQQYSINSKKIKALKKEQELLDDEFGVGTQKAELHRAELERAVAVQDELKFKINATKKAIDEQSTGMNRLNKRLQTINKSIQ